MNTKLPLIEFINIRKIYKTGSVEYVALKDINITILEGEFVAIMGPSGSGKSTIMNLIGALDVPTSGLYRLKGKRIDTYSEDELSEIRNKEIGFIFQAFNLLPRVTVLHNIERPMMYAGIPKQERTKRAQEVLKRVGLSDKAANFSNQLSGGQIQRVAVARALVMNPALLLADEPTGNLDSKTAHEIMTFFKSLHKNGHSIILITHEKDIASYAERILYVKDGFIKKDTMHT